MTGLGDGARGVRTQHVVATGGSIVIQVAGDLVVSEEGLAESWALTATRPGECPYPGMGAFGPGQAMWFFGRDKLTGELLEMLDVSLCAGRWGPFIVVGASGAGKSSLLAAGLVKALGDGRLGVTGSERWPVVVITPGSSPLETLTEAVSRCAAELANRMVDPPSPFLPGWESAFADLSAALRRSSNGGSPQRVTVVVDKLEELFTAGCGEAERNEFLDALAAIAAPASGGPVGLVVLGMRADFYASATQYPALREALQSRQLVVGAMTLAEVTQAITGPARAAGLYLEPGLTERLLRDLGAGADGTGYEPGRLPLLGQALRATWQRRSGERLTISGYEDADGIGGAIAKAAEDAYRELEAHAQLAARQLFLSMVQVGSGEPGGEGTADTRRRVSKSRLCSNASDPDTAEAVLDVFTQARLVTFGGQTAEITHEALLSRWPRLRDWIEQDRAGHLIRQPLEEAAEAWDRAGRNQTADLYTGSRLAQAQAWASDLAASRDLSSRAREFLAASGRRQRRAIRRRNQVIAVLAALSLFAVSAAAFAWLEDRTAGQQRNAAVAGQLAAESEALDTTNPVEAASLAAAAWKIDPTAATRDSLLDVLAQPARRSITAVSGNITAINFSPDGKRLATATDTGAVQVWDMATRREVGEPLRLGDGQNIDSISFGAKDTATTVSSAEGPGRFWDINTRRPVGPSFRIPDESVGIGSSIFSPDGTVIAAEATNMDFALIDASTHREIGSAIHAAWPLAFSPDGKLLAVADLSNLHGLVKLLNVATRHVTDTVSHGMDITQYMPAAAFSPDGKIIAITEQKSVDLWDIARHRIIGSPIAVTATAVAFSPNGKMLATISSSGATDLWDTGSHQQLGGPLTQYISAYGGVLAFSPDSTTLATADRSTVTFWDVAISRQIGATIGAAIIGSGAPFAFDAGGRVLAAFTGDRTVGLWSVATRRKLGSPFQVRRGTAPIALALSPDGKILAIGMLVPGGGVQLWDVATHRQIGKRILPSWGIKDLAFSPNGKYLAIGVSSGAWLWDVNVGHIIGRSMTIGQSPDRIIMAFSPDGRVLATGGRQIRLYRVATQRQIGITFPADGGQANGIAFSPDGNTLAIASDTGVALRNAATQHQIGVQLNVGVGPVQALAFSPDGTILAVADSDGTIRLWDAASHEQIGSPLIASHNPIYGITFSPDGTVLAAAAKSETRLETSLWGVVLTHDVLNRVCAIAGGSMTRQAWNFYVKAEPFQQTCPN